MLQRVGLILRVARFGEILRDGSVRTDKDGNRFVERNPQRLGLVERVRISRVTTEVMKVLLDLAR